MAFATGRYMMYPFFAHAYEVEDIVGMVRLNFAGRVTLHRGVAELAPGITLHPMPGHTAGLQAVRVHTSRGWVVLASDTAHYFENMADDRPFPICFHVGHMIDSFRAIEALAASPAHIVPGHDPSVMRLYSPPTPALEGIIVRVDLPPKEEPPCSKHVGRS